MQFCNWSLLHEQLPVWPGSTILQRGSFIKDYDLSWNNQLIGMLEGIILLLFYFLLIEGCETGYNSNFYKINQLYPSIQ